MLIHAAKPKDQPTPTNKPDTRPLGRRLPRLDASSRHFGVAGVWRAETMTNHALKTWPEPFAAVLAGNKNFEVRINDRDFAVGDTLELNEFDPDTQHYTGRQVHRLVTYMVRGGEWGLPKNLCILGWAIGDYIATQAGDSAPGQAGQS